MSPCTSLWKNHVLPLSSGCLALTGGVQMISAVFLANSVFVLLHLLIGSWSFVLGLTLMVTFSRGYIRNHSGISRRRKVCVSLLLCLTTVILVVSILLIHLQRILIIEPWIDVVSSRKHLKYDSVSQAFNDVGIWVVTVTSITGAIASLLGLLSILPFGFSNSFPLHNNLSTMESAGWVYESTPTPDVLLNCPPHGLQQTHIWQSHHKSRKPASKVNSVTLVSFKHENSLQRQTKSLPTRSERERRIVFVESCHRAPTLPVNLDFGSNRPLDSPRYQQEFGDISRYRRDSPQTYPLPGPYPHLNSINCVDL